MPVPFITSGITNNSGVNIASLTLDYATAGGTNDPNAPTPNTIDYCWLAVLFLTGGAYPLERSLSTPSGWTLEVEAEGASANEFSIPGIKIYIFSKPYDGGGGLQIFEADGESARIQGVMALCGGVNLSSPVSQANGNNTGITSNHSTGSITPDFVNSLLLAAWLSSDTPARFVLPTGMSDHYSSQASSAAGVSGTLVASVGQSAIAAVSKTAQSVNGNTGNTPYNVNGCAAIAAINPSQLPSQPDLIAPNGGESYVVGISVAISWIAALSEVVASSLLKYHIQYSPDNGNTWADVVALTSAGVTTYSWSTAGRSVGSQYLIRIRATSDSGSTFGPYETSSATFSLVAETTPGKPTNVHIEQPAGTSVSVVDRDATVRCAWTHAQQSSNPQTTYTGRWSYNSDMSSPTTFNPGTGANQYHEFSATTFNHGATVYIQVRTTGLTLQSDWSDPVSFVASTKPAVNITAPVAASPPTVSFPTITVAVTTGDMSQRRYRFTQGGNQVYDSGFVATSQLSFVSQYSLATGVEYVLLVSIKNQYGLASAEDSETFTPAFSAPAQPTITATALTEDGCIQLNITNTDTPDENQIFRDGVLIAEGVGVNGVFRDFTAKHGVEYSYVARAVNSTGFTDSDPDAATLTLDKFWLAVLTKTSSTSNASSAVGLLNEGSSPWSETINVDYAATRGLRLLPLPLIPPRRQQSLSCVAVMSSADETTLQAVGNAYSANLDVCARDQFGARVIGKIHGLSIGATDQNVVTISLTVTESDYSEDLEAA